VNVEPDCLVLTFQIKMWNDTAIKALNPTIAHLLPETEIIVAYVTTAQTSVQAIMEAISDRVPEFKDEVRRPPP
jgi:hypothetical protein